MGRIGLHQLDGATVCNSGAARRRGVGGTARGWVLLCVAAALVAVDALCGCTGDDTSTATPNAPAATATLKSLDAKQLTGLCGQFPHTRSA